MHYIFNMENTLTVFLFSSPQIYRLNSCLPVLFICKRRASIYAKSDVIIILFYFFVCEYDLFLSKKHIHVELTRSLKDIHR